MVGFRINIDGLTGSPEVKLSLVVGKDIQQRGRRNSP